MQKQKQITGAVQQHIKIHLKKFQETIAKIDTYSIMRQTNIGKAFSLLNNLIKSTLKKLYNNNQPQNETKNIKHQERMV